MRRLVCVAISILMIASTPTYAFSFASIQAFLTSLKNENSAWSVTTKQTSVAANQVTQSDIVAKEQLATAIGAIDMSNRVVDAVVSTDSKLGQPNTIKCVAQQNGKLHVEADSQKEKDASKLMQTFASTRVGSQADADKKILNLHRSTYCTVSEAKQGLCQLVSNGMQGWDTNYAGAFSEATLAPEAELAAYAYAAMVADHRAPVHIDCKDVACQSAASQDLGMAAISAMSASALIDQVTDRRQPMLTGQ